jgi:hypothetical protein
MPWDASEIRPAGDARGKALMAVATSSSIAMEIQETPARELRIGRIAASPTDCQELAIGLPMQGYIPACRRSCFLADRSPQPVFQIHILNKLSLLPIYDGIFQGRFFSVNRGSILCFGQF